MIADWNGEDYLDHPSIDDGRYIVLSCLGSGGMGAVLHAYDQRLKTYRAIKVLKPELVSRQDVRQRFTREAVSMAQLNHPHVIQIFDYGQESLTMYIVMEYIPGNSLQSYLDEMGKLTRNQALSVCLQVARGLEYIHDEGFIHRDIKPANILLSSQGAKIADFGLVRSELDQFKTHSAAVIGTFAFMSPEQRLGAKHVGLQTDIYALTASLYMMLTLENPVDLYREEERAQAIAYLDKDLQTFINRGMNKDKSIRYQSCETMIVELEKLMLSSGDKKQKRLPPYQSEATEKDLNKLLSIWKQYTTVGYQSPELNDEDLFASTILPTEEDGSIQELGSDLSAQEKESEKQDNFPKVTENQIEKLSGESRDQSVASSSVNIIRMISLLIGSVLIVWLGKWGLDFNTEQALLKETRQYLSPLVKLNKSELSSAIKAEQALMNMRYSEVGNELGNLKEPMNTSTLRFALRAIKRKEYRLNTPIRFDDIQSDLNAGSKHKISQLLIKSMEAHGDWESIIKAWRTQTQERTSPLLHLIMLSAIEHSPKILQAIERQRVLQLFPNLSVFDHWKLLTSAQKGDENDKQLLALEHKYPEGIGFRLEQARSALNHGKINLAEDRLKRILRADEHYTPARALLAKLYIDQGDEQKRLNQFMIAIGDQVSAEDQQAYLYIHAQDLNTYGKYRETEKLLAFCSVEALKNKNAHAALACIQFRVLSRLWHGRLAASDALFKEYTSMLESAELDERSRLYFTNVQLYIRAHLALNRSDLDEIESILNEIDELPKLSGFKDIKELITYIKSLRRLQQDLPDQFKETWLTRTKSLGSSSSCLKMYGESLWAKRLDERETQKALLQKIVSKACTSGLLGELLSVEAQLSLITVLIDQQEVVKALELEKSFKQNWRGTEQDLVLYPKLKFTLGRLNAQTLSKELN